MIPPDPSQLRRLYAWGVPQREAKLVLNGLTDTPALSFAKEWVRAAGELTDLSVLVLAGPKGVGKTVAAGWVIVHADPAPADGLAKWLSSEHPRFLHVSDIVVFGDAAIKAQRTELSHCRCVVIDDVGVENLDAAFGSVFDALINARYGSAGYTVITTNLTSEQFKTRYGERVYDRIRGRGDWYDIDHESLRGATGPGPHGEG